MDTGLMPRIVGAAFYQWLLLAWAGMFAVAMLYCLLRSLVDSSYSYVPIDTLIWTVAHWGAWPLLLPVCIYLIRIVERRRSLLAGLVVGMVLAILGASMFAYVVWISLGWQLSLYGVAYHMAPIAAGTYVVFGVVALLLFRQIAHSKTIDEAIVSNANSVVLTVWKGQFLTKIDAAFIEWSRAARNYVEIHADGKSYLMRTSMAEFERLLPEGRFLRAHRSYLVNTKFVVGVVGGKARPSVVLKSGSTIPVGNKYKHAVLTAIRQESAAA